MAWCVCMVHMHNAHCMAHGVVHCTLQYTVQHTAHGLVPSPLPLPSALPPQQALEQPGGPPEKRRPQRKEAAGDAEADGLVKLISARPTGGGGL